MSTGGCEGGTPEVAYASAIAANGVASAKAYPYASGGGSDFKCKLAPSMIVANISNYVVLPSNEATPLLDAVATVGPLAIAVDASAWDIYDSGVFDGCDANDIDLDHAVQLVGYGTDTQDYWLVRNSWSSGWGEDGYIRILRGSATSPKCGTDSSPQVTTPALTTPVLLLRRWRCVCSVAHGARARTRTHALHQTHTSSFDSPLLCLSLTLQDGVGCNGGPASVKVCGSCGILYDTVYPTI